MDINDLGLITPKAFSAIIRDEAVGEKEARKRNNHLTKRRLWSYIHDNRIGVYG